MESDIIRNFVNNVTKVCRELIEDEPCIIVDIDDPDDMEHANDVSNATFISPSQNDNPSSANNFKCEMCDIYSATSVKKRQKL